MNVCKSITPSYLPSNHRSNRRDLAMPPEVIIFTRNACRYAGKKENQRNETSETSETGGQEQSDKGAGGSLTRIWKLAYDKIKLVR